MKGKRMELIPELNVLDLDDSPHAIMFGNLSDGFEIIGPFNGWDSALEYDQKYIHWGPTWIMPMKEPAANE
jgi:hypothetical protein